jgi:hypothetical protein
MTGTQMQWRNDRGAPHRLYSRHSTPHRVLPRNVGSLLRT